MNQMWLWLAYGIPSVLMLAESYLAYHSSVPVFLWGKSRLKGIHDVIGFNKGVGRCCLIFACVFAFSSIPAFFASNPIMALLTAGLDAGAFLFLYFDYSRLLQQYGKF